MSWTDTALTRLLGIDLPIVQAPMAGGYSTPALAAAVCEAGGLGSLAGAGLAPEQLREAIAATRRLTGRPFAVNLFAPLPPPSSRHLLGWATVTDMPLPVVPRPPGFAEQLEVVHSEGAPVLSFTFGSPELAGVDAIRIGTATSVAEAVALERAGVAAVVAQGFEAGGHRGAFLDDPGRSLVGTLALVPQVVDAVSVPVIAAGGIMDGRGIAAALALGAAGVQLGTAFLGCPEAGTSPAHRAALALPTTITKVLTGRHARAVRTAEVDRLEASGVPVPDYPLPRSFLRELPMLTGQGGPLARDLPGGELIKILAAETTAALVGISSR